MKPGACLLILVSHECWTQGLHLSPLPSQAHEQGTELQVEQLGLELVLLWDVRVIGIALCATPQHRSPIYYFVGKLLLKQISSKFADLVICAYIKAGVHISHINIAIFIQEKKSLEGYVQLMVEQTHKIAAV